MPILSPIAPFKIGLHAVNDTMSLKEFLDKIAKGARFVSGGWIGHAARQISFVQEISKTIGNNAGQGFSSITEASLTAFCRSIVKRQLTLATGKITDSGSTLIVNAISSGTPLQGAAPLMSLFLSSLGQRSLESTINELTENLVAVLKPTLCKRMAKSVGDALSSWVASSAEVYIGNKIQQQLLYFLALQFNSIQANGVSDFLSAASEVDGMHTIVAILAMMLIYHLMVYLYERYVLESQMDDAVSLLSNHLIKTCPNKTRIPDQIYQFAVSSAVSIILRGARVEPDYITTMFAVKDFVEPSETALKRSN